MDSMYGGKSSSYSDEGEVIRMKGIKFSPQEPDQNVLRVFQ